MTQLGAGPWLHRASSPPMHIAGCTWRTIDVSSDLKSLTCRFTRGIQCRKSQCAGNSFGDARQTGFRLLKSQFAPGRWKNPRQRKVLTSMLAVHSVLWRLRFSLASHSSTRCCGFCRFSPCGESSTGFAPSQNMAALRHQVTVESPRMCTHGPHHPFLHGAIPTRLSPRPSRRFGGAIPEPAEVPPSTQRSGIFDAYE